ncbi:pyrimidine-specific ribonucleoside hydrolase RihA [soil metagenome]
MQTPARVVIDCDPGRDDALAILAALGAPQFQVDFITTVAGNVTVDRGTSNALGVLAVAGVEDVRVYRGAAAPLARTLEPGLPLHGDMADGEPRLPSARRSVAGDAHEALRAWCREPGDLPTRLVAIGPLTNLGRLLREDENALAGVDDVFVMGGTVGQIETRVSPTAEFNFHTDPEAAELVIRSGASIRLYDYDVTTSCQIPVDAVPEIAGVIGSPVGEHVGGWLRHLWEYSNRVYGRQGIAVHDLYAVAGAAGVGPDRWEWFEMSIDRTERGRGTVQSRPAGDGQGVAVARGLDPATMAEFLASSARNLPRGLAK